eukprot:TRINITY_DN1517_c0_g1_i2.p1 TRINITY_DN1517_c0_g1~~TRINITY_DN1517_c0_g1_i2.p1  ORF type:complete len:329 (-),score=105.45 TRINITY_DN1517_c0_g1_i2:33-1019(-)
MPPKKSNAPSKKTQEKAKDKVVVDKTFGLKNKNKSSKVQKYITSVEKQVKGGVSGKTQNAEFEKKKKKEEEEQRKKMEADLFKPAVAKSKVAPGVDPKSVLCEFFKVGLCTKGDKCKFSHNLDVERRTAKIDASLDPRSLSEEDQKKADTMETWDQSKLESVVTSKQGLDNKNLKTTIVCRYFLEALESKHYGWFWECPNGEKCIYVHALPPGFQLKSSVKKEDMEDHTTPLEELLEIERANLTTRTPLTKELFLKWKTEKQQKIEEEKKAKAVQRAADIKSGKAMRSGRDLFVYNPDLFVDDEDTIDVTELEPEDKDEVRCLSSWMY